MEKTRVDEAQRQGFTERHVACVRSETIYSVLSDTNSDTVQNNLKTEKKT